MPKGYTTISVGVDTAERVKDLRDELGLSADETVSRLLDETEVDDL